MAHEQDVHRLFLHFQELPYSRRVLYTMALLVLAVGYSFAMIYLYASYANRDGDPMMTARDIQIAYAGNQESTRLEAALSGTMSGMLPPDEKSQILGWLHGEKTETGYQAVVEPIINKRCLACHDGSNPHLPNLKGFENLSKMAEADQGADIFSLVRVTHIHLFGITFIFFILGFVFTHAYVRPVWLKCAVIALPYFALVADIFSWYVTKFYPPFAYVVIAGGAIYGMSFAFMWLVSMYQMWFYKMPEALKNRHQAVEPVLG